MIGSEIIPKKEIRDMRDWWYRTVQQMYPDNRQISKIEVLSNRLDQYQKNQITPDEFKSQLRAFADEIINSLSSYSAVLISTALASASASAESSAHAFMAGTLPSSSS